MGCVFCSIVSGDIPAAKMYEDDLMVIIKDIEPKAERHFLLIPKRHYKLISDMTEQDVIDFGKCIKKIPQLTDILGLEGGYRLVINQGDDAGQTVFHLHVHILCGQKMDFPRL